MTFFKFFRGTDGSRLPLPLDWLYEAFLEIINRLLSAVNGNRTFLLVIPLVAFLVWFGVAHPDLVSLTGYAACITALATLFGASKWGTAKQIAASAGPALIDQAEVAVDTVVASITNSDQDAPQDGAEGDSVG